MISAYVVTMFKDSHNYIVGAYSNEILAIEAGEIEQSNSGEGYDFKIDKVRIDMPPTLEALKRHYG